MFWNPATSHRHRSRLASRTSPPILLHRRHRPALMPNYPNGSNRSANEHMNIRNEKLISSQWYILLLHFSNKNKIKTKFNLHSTYSWLISKNVYLICHFKIMNIPYVNFMKCASCNVEKISSMWLLCNVAARGWNKRKNCFESPFVKMKMTSTIISIWWCLKHRNLSHSCSP